MFKFWKNRKKIVSQRAYDAMVTLLDHYENLTPMLQCPLCQISSGCSNCTWKIFEGMTCSDWSTDIPSICKRPEDYPFGRYKRIKMLKNWISRSKVTP
jgi:hypothetical protein